MIVWFDDDANSSTVDEPSVSAPAYDAPEPRVPVTFNVPPKSLRMVAPP